MVRVHRESNHRLTEGELRSGASVAFRLGDAVCPQVGQITAQINPDVRVCGEVVFFSDHGGKKAHFAIISAAGIDVPLIVPVAKLRLVGGGPVAGSKEGSTDTLIAPEGKRGGKR